jgi:signal transduction histidine kinase/ligand-binding sensor domain-containing protein/CheY-like chemotaxis protein
MRYLLYIALLFGFARISSSQPKDIRFKHYSTNQGLSQSWVRTIYQDSIGYLWFGTADGLNRFDGMEFKIYRPEFSAKNSLGNAAINQIKYKNTLEMWVATERGIYIYNRINDSFKPFKFFKQLNVSSIVTDKSGNSWFGTNNGLYCFNPSDSSVQNFKNDPSNNATISNNAVHVIYIDSKQNIWIGTDNGLNKLNTSGIIQRYYHKSDNETPNTNIIQCITEDKFGRIWVGTRQRSLDIIRPEITNPQADPYIFVMKGSPFAIHVDTKNTLWICEGAGQGLDLLDLNAFVPGTNPKISHYYKIPEIEWSLSDNSIVSIFEDKDHNIWLGSFGGGINFYSDRSKKFNIHKQLMDLSKSISNNYVNCFLEEEKYLWIGTEGGLNRLNKKTGIYDHFYALKDKTNLTGSAIYALLKDSRGNLWYGAWAGGLNKFNYKTEKFQSYLADGKPGSIKNNNVFSICEDRKGNLWIGSVGGGLNLFHYETGKFSSFMHEPGNQNSIRSNTINHIIEARDGDLFISAFTSLEQFNYKTKTFRHYVFDPGDPNSLSDGFTIAVFEDSQNHIWVATSMGLNLLNRDKGTFTHYTKQQGLPGNFICGIQEDAHHNLWISTNNGLSKFINGALVPNETVFKNYTYDDGLPGNEFSVHSSYKNKDGKMYFGLTTGFIYFYPNDIKNDPLVPDITITDFQLLNMEKNQQLQEIINSLNSRASRDLHLTYKQSDFIIKYAGLNYLTPTKNKYKYMLDGYEKIWHDVGNKREATYTNIQPGTYIFKVIGSNSDGIWASKTATLRIIIHPPWWGTLFFKAFLALFFVLIIFTGYWLRFRLVESQKLKLEHTVASRTDELVKMNSLLEQRQDEISIQNEELSQHRNNLEKLVEKRTSELELAKRKAEESDKLKSAFLANMGHEIRTPMNAIVGFASLLNSDEFTENEKRTFIETINNNSEALLVLIDDILDISLIESNQLKLTKQKFDVAHILTELESYYLLKNKKNIQIRFETNQFMILDNDPIRFRQIVSNLINNAIKYTDKGHIHFGYEILEKDIRFYVKDTGIGLAPENHENIFNHFFKIEKDKDRLYRGTGIGLSICKKLAHLMGGNIWVESELSRGSDFYFTLPKYDKNIAPIPVKNIKKDLFQNLKGIKILVTEDETDNYKLIESILRPFQAEILWAKNGMEAINMVQTNNFTVKNFIILMDIKMPVMNGIEATRIIKSINKSIPVVAITAYAQPDDRVLMHQENFDGYLSKPFKPDDLLAIIAKYTLDL